MPSSLRAVPGYSNYYVSSAGNVYSIRSVGKKGEKKKRRRKLSPYLNKGRSKNYLRITLYQDRKRKNYYIHELVLLAFVGPRPEGLVIAHLDDDPFNNRLENLRYVTREENEYHKTSCYKTRMINERIANGEYDEEKVPF